MNKGEIWNVNLNPWSGHETKGQHFVLIISQDSFNHAFRVPCVVPIMTVGNYDRERGFTVSLMGAGTRTTGVLCCSQYRTMDIKSRGGRYVEDAPDYIVEEVLEKVLTTLD